MVPMLQGVWTRCPRGLSLRRLAKERSARTLMCWKIARAHIQSTHTYLRGQNVSMNGQTFVFTTVGLVVSTSHAASCFFCNSPGWKWFLYSSPPEKEQYDISSISNVLKPKVTSPQFVFKDSCGSSWNEPVCPDQVSPAQSSLCKTWSHSHFFHLMAAPTSLSWLFSFKLYK